MQLLDTEKLINTVYLMMRNAQQMALHQEDPDIAVKQYAQAHAFQMVLDIMASGECDMINDDTVIN